jgi:hypothetical protein
MDEGVPPGAHGYACPLSVHGWKAAVNRLTPEVSRIIRGDSGKAGTGWLARPLLSRIARFGGGGRIHQFL